MHQYLNRNLLRRILVISLAIATIFVISCGGDAADDAAAPPTPTPVDISAIASELQESISDAVSGIEVPEGMTEEEVQQIVASAVAAAAS